MDSRSERLVQVLHAGGYSLAVWPADGEIRTFTGRGVADLYRLMREDPEVLRGAIVADKVVGKAAAALMLAGGVQALYTDTVSTLARELLDGSVMEVCWEREVPHIINRMQTDWCPLEKLCRDCRTPEECLRQIEDFMQKQK